MVLGRFSNCVYFKREQYGLYADVPPRRVQPVSAAARYFVRNEGRMV